MRRPTIGILAGIGLLVLAIILAARGAAPVAAQPLPPIATPQSAHLVLSATLSGSDGATGETFEITMRGEGDVDAARRTSRFTYDLVLPAELADPATPMPERLTVEMVVADGRLYTRDSDKGRWTWVALPAGDDAFQLMPDASDWAADWGGDAPTFARVGPATLNGAATTHWHATYDLGDLLLADLIPATPTAAPAPTMTVTVDLWIGDDDAYLHRMTTELRFAGIGEDGQDGSFAMAMVAEYSAFDQPVAIVVPEGAVPAIEGAAGEPATSFFPSLSALPLDGSTFALPGSGNTIAGVFPGGTGTTVVRPGSAAATATSGSGRPSIRIGPTEPPAASRPSAAPRATATSAPPTATRPHPTATVAVAANAALPPTVAAQPQATTQAPRTAAASSNNRLFIFGAAGLIVLCGGAGALLFAARTKEW